MDGLDPKLRDAIANMAMNSRLKRIDDVAKDGDINADLQMGVLMMAQVLAFRRLCTQHGVKDRGKRLKLIKTATAEFEKRLRQYGNPDNALPDTDRPAM